MILKDLESLIDKAVSRDFIIHQISDEDRQNDSYKALEFTLSFNNIAIEYERKVESSKYPVIPRYQYLFGFYPREGLCLYVNKQEHKLALCDGPLEDIASSCSLVHSLIYLIVPVDRFEVYSYLPACCELNCSNSPKQFNLRINLFNDKTN
ncbi:MAG: hypothetical protein EU539_06005 [Promethearchaeota archaeon]|nr:MAG: hypothetical protein EU539_06005 [Candidatus Lokiarchaeota archaeon]